MEVDKMDLLQQQIIGLCHAHPEGFPLSQLSSLYQQMYKTPFKLSDYGFHSTSGLLEHMKDVVQLDYDGRKVIIKSASGKGSAECSCPSSSMLEKLPLVNLSYNQMRIPNQHQVNKEARLKDELMRLFCCYPEGITLHKLQKLYKRQYKKHLNAADYKFPTVQAMLESMNDILCLIPTNKGFTIKTKSRKYTRKMQERILQIPETSFGSSETQTLIQGETKRDCKPGNKPSLAQPPLQQKVPTGNDLLVLQEEILNLIKDKSKGIPVRRIRKAYKTAYERPLNIDSGSLQRALKLMKNKLFVQHSGTYALVFENELAAVKLMEKLRAEILDLLRTEPNGIPEAKLCEMYNKKNRCNLRTKSYGFGSISELIRSMADVVDIVRTSGKNIIKLKPAQPSGVIKTEDNKGSNPVPAPLPSMEIINRNFASQCIYPHGKNNDCRCWKPDSGLEDPHAQLPQAPGAMYGQNITPMSGMFYSAPLNRFPLPQVATFGFTERQTVSPALSTSSSDDDPEKSGGCAKPKSCQTEETSRKCYAPATAINPRQVQNTTAQPTEPYTLNQKMTASVNPGSRSASPALTTVSSDDFPALDTKVSKEELKKLKEEELRKMRSKDQFTQNYHRYVREEHRSVMQLADTLTSEPVMYHRNRNIDVEEVNQQTEEFIRALAADREQVTEKKVLDRVCRHFRVQNMKDIGIWSPVRQLSAVQELRQTQREVTIFIEAFETMRSVCTLYELNQCLGALKNKPNFEDLRLGPLCKQPLVHRLFKVPESLKDEDIFEIETVDILQSIRAYRKSSKAQRIDLADFIKYLADQYDCDSPYALGIRITSIGLLISTLGKVSSTERTAIDKAKNRVQKEIEEEVDNRFNKVKKNLMDPFGGPQLYSTSGSLDLRKQYVSMTAADAILQVFINAKEVFSNRMTKHVQDFLIKIGEDRLARALFQLAICCGSLEVPEDLVAKEKTNKTAVNRGRDNETPLPSEGSVREYLEKSLSTVTGYLNLVYLCKLEKRLVDHFKLKGFVDMGHGTYLEYLLKHSQLLEETAGGSLFLYPQDTGMCGFRPSHQDVHEFIRQCGTLGDSMFPAIEVALCKQFRVRAIKELGYRTVSSIVKMVQHQTKSHTEHNNLQSMVLYETALFFEEFSHSNSSSVGLLGDLSQEQALSCLLNAPLLEDLAEWSQWETIFEAQHGSLKDFIERHCGKKAAHLSLESSAVLNDLVAIEIKPGVLLRLTTETNAELFARAVTLHDPVGTAGHLVSIVVADGLRNAPLALLANHVETALAACGGLEANVLKTEGLTSHLSTNFILDCLIRIPVRLCKLLLQKIFLEPFSRVIGQSESKELLLQAARSSSRYLNRLHELGILLGITEWMKDYQIKLDPAKLSKLTSKATKAVDSVLVSSGSSLAGLSETEDSDVAKSESNSECKSASISSDDEVDQESEKFVLADEVSDQPPSDEKVSDHSSDIMTINSAAPASSDVTNKEQCSAGIANEEESVCRNIIESIRKNEFGIGIELNDEGKKLMEVHQNRLGRSLERLSTELYSKDTHFVLELIQNADDNSYPPSSDGSPSLLFVVEKECIILLNNECGFQEKHIRAICDVGCSTKGKHEYGYIVLPLKSQNQQAQNLFHDIDPSLLLFLHRLRSITVINKVKAQDLWVSRQDFNNNILEVKHKTGTDRWLVIKKILDARKIKDNVELTELALAFKLNTEKQKLAVRCLPEKQPVFAFLPLRSFGFRFIIQGDFDIPSSREDIDRDSLWNQWLRCEIPQLLLEAMETFKNHPNFKGLEGLCHFLQFLPLPDEILDFFQPVAGQIIQLLKAQTCLPTIEDKDGKTEYRLPSQTAITHDALLREVITPELLQKHLNLAYLNPVLQSALNPALVSALGIHKLSSADIIAITKAIAKELTQTNSAFDDDDMKKIAKLLVCNYRSLDQEYGNTEQLLDDLKSVPIIPLADGRMVSLKGQAIFFPLYDEENEQFVNRVQGIQELYRDLKTIHPNVLTCLDNLGNSQIRKLLEGMDVYYLKPDKVMFEYILPTLKEQKWKEKSQGVVVSYSIFLKMHCQDNELQQFRPYIPVLTNKGFVCPAHVNVNFTCNYKNAINLPVDLPGVDWVLLDSCYLRTDNDSEGWRMYFSSLGVQDLFVFQKKKRTFTKQELVSSPWAQICELWPSTADNTYIVEDYVCEELHTLLTTEVLSDQMKFQQRINLLKLFDRNWDSGCRLSQYCTARLLNSQDKILKNEIHSSFAMYLATLSWLPTDSPAEDGAGFCTAYLRPSEVYLRSNNLMELLANRVSYVSCDLLEKSTFAAFTGIKTSISVDMMINHFKSWCVKTPTNVEKIPAMKHYVSLLVLICSKVSFPSSDILQDVSVIYAVLAEKCKIYDNDDNWELQYPYCQTLKGMLKDEKVFPAKDNRWVSLASSPMIPDNKQLERIFKAHSLCLLNLPAAERNLPNSKTKRKQEFRFNEDDRNLFFEICGVKPLSSCITVEAQTENYVLCPKVQNFIHSLVPFIQRWLFHHDDFSHIYEDLQSGNVAARLKSMIFIQVNKLYLHYKLTLPDDSIVYENENIVCHLKGSKEFYIQKDHITSRIDICREFVKFFSDERRGLQKELEHFLQSLISYFEDEPALQKFLQKEGVEELPEDEEKWEVPKALEIRPEPPRLPGDQHRTLSTSTKATGEPPHHQELQNSQSQHVPKECTDPASISEWKTDSNQSKPPCRESTANQTPGQPPVTTSDHTSQQPVVSVTKNNHFSGADMNTPCPPIPLDVPVWTKQLPHEDVLEELLIHGMMEKPQTVVFNEDKVENYAIGEWGERLVHAFLIHWKESDSQHKPRDIMWANENGESGLPYDFKVIFTSMNDEQVETFIEVKSTIKAEKNFVQLSAQEVDLALKVKDRYHLYRVYKAGDSQNVQLCRIKNLAQCLHAKQLELFLFV
ncbi:hypothetical protein chiPu_0017434 [Chiloscyllium punctatum]|uniref:HTH OST-type domain-containing protein n=1 Tax=Chiloscyllium punctatum TaxID=137246 RepID=A0A401RFY6_CHIPU|nr:hypothetical protein [Chiloscyllium punctatum]